MLFLLLPKSTQVYFIQHLIALALDIVCHLIDLKSLYRANIICLFLYIISYAQSRSHHQRYHHSHAEINNKCPMAVPEITQVFESDPDRITEALREKRSDPHEYVMLRVFPS
jgi:hypothetical protein